MRKKLIQLQQEIAELQEEYISSHTALLYITEHAMCRFIERELNFSLYTHRNDDNEANTLMSFCNASRMHPSKIREMMLTYDEQAHIVRNNIGYFKKGNCAFIIKNLSVTTVVALAHKQAL